jgi:cellulose synthase/poly-beta-1,6-N-acetylglucosamine synthase-like glycosyltransferase/tetratricopeptide (TPR) repeat protein
MNPVTLPSPVFRKFMIVLASIMCVFYLAYRAIFTFNLSTNYAIFASVFLFVGELFGILNLLLYFLQVWEVNEPAAEAVLEGRTVDVLVPTYNEDVQLLRATLEACIRMDYPHKTYVLDDGRRPEVEGLARDLGVIYISRPDNRHAKAGNLNNALEQTDGEFVVVLDADHVPEPHFITRLIGYFHDEKVAFVQTPHAFYNFDSFQARLDHKNRRYWEEGDLFYRVIQPGRNKWNAPIFAGSAAMFRRKALKEIGYIATETITEDLHTGLRLHGRGWKSIAMSERLIAGQAPPDITSFHSQRLRWGEGNLSIMAYDNPLTMRGLNLQQRLCYFGSMIHWASGVFKLAIYLTPILMLFTGVPPVREFNWTLIVVIFTYLFISLYAMKVVSNGYGSIVNSELFSMVNFWTQCKATFRAIFRRSRQRFVVTKKRGQQSKSIWPYVRPQTYMIIVSVLAIVWGWLRLSLDLNPIHAVIRLMERLGFEITSRFAHNIENFISGTLVDYPIWVGSGISDDYFKPVVPTIWCLIFFWLAYKVTQRAFWPADRRFSTRHLVHLPVEYESHATEEAATRFGVTVDLNDTGMAFVAYEQLALNSVVRFTIRGAGEVVRLRGEIRSGSSVTRRGPTEGHRYGVQFKDLTPPQIDALNRVCLHYAVPRMFDEYERGNRDTLWNRLKLWQSRGMAQRRNAKRNPFTLPIIINTGSSEDTTMFSTTEDISRVAAAAMFDHEVPAGANVGFLLPSPLGDVRGVASVVRSQPQVVAGRTYYRSVLEFKDFEGQGRTTLQSLVNPNENSPLASVLKPDKKAFLPNMRVPILIGLLIATVLAIAQMRVAFPFYYKDDEFLRELIDSNAAPSADELARYKRILAETLHERHPSTDRLVLLMSVGNKINEADDVKYLTEELAVRDPQNLQLSKALVMAYEKAGKLPQAEKEYLRLRALEDRGMLSEQERFELNYAGARVAFLSHNFPEAIKRYRELYEKYPNRVVTDKDNKPMTLRNLYAGVCIQGGDPAAAIQLLTSTQVIDVDDRKLLIAAYVQLRAFDEAAKQAKRLVAETNDSAESLEILAQIEAARKDYDAQRDILERLVQRQGENPEPEILIRLAEANNALKRYDEAIELTGRLFDKQNFAEGARDAFLNAASQVNGIEKDKPGYDAKKAEMVDKYARALFVGAMASSAADEKQAIYLTRLGWVLQRLGDAKRSSEAVAKAMEILPQNAQIREQLAGLLLRAGRTEQAIRVLVGVNTKNARLIRIGVHLENKEFTEALQLARANFDSERTWENEKYYADILSWKGDPSSLAEATKIYERHYNEAPDEETEARIAELSLWAKHYTDATSKFMALLDSDAKFELNAKKYGDGFINAAAGAKELTPAQLRIAAKLADLRLREGPGDPLMTARLAWVLLQGKDRARAEALLSKLDVKSVKPESRKEVANVLAGAGLFRQAIELAPNPQTDRERLDVAQLYIGAKEWDKAIAQIKRVLAEKTGDVPLLKEANHLLADIYSYKGDYAESLRLFTVLRSENPTEPIFEIREAEVMLWSKEIEKALPLFEELYRRFGANPRVWLGYVSTVAAIGGHNTRFKITPIESKTAIETTERIAERVLIAPTPASPELLSRLALALYYCGDFEKADLFVSKALDLKSEDPVMRRELANALWTLKRYKEAIDQYQSFELTADDRRRLIDIASDAEDLDLAVRQARILVQQNPTNRLDKKVLADVMAWRGDFSESIALYEQLLKDQPEDADNLKTQIADVWLWWRHYPEAFIRYSELLATRPEQVYLGFIDAASSAPNRSPEQIKQLLQVYDRFKDKMTDVARMARLASVLTKSNHGAEADYLLDRALKLNTTDVNARIELANALSARDRVPEAIAVFASVESSLNFNERITYAILLTSMGSQKDLEEAEKQFKKLIDAPMHSRDTELRIRYAEMLKWSGKYDKSRYVAARKEFEALAREFPNDVRFPINIAQCLLWSGHYEESLPRFEELLDTAVIKDRKLERDVWMGFCDSVAGTIGEILRRAGLENENPDDYLKVFFTAKLRESALKAYRRASAVQPERPERVTERYLSEVRYYSESLGRLGLCLGLMGDRERGREAFEKAISLNRQDRVVWEQYAQSLTMLKEYLKARAIYDALKADKLPDELPR